MVPPNMPEDEAAALFPIGVFSKELPSGRKYLRYTPDPLDRKGCVLPPAEPELPTSL